MFTGEMVDANDLVYLRARYYAPELGVFTGLDPVENLSRYQYVSANPVNHVDPSGLQGGAEAILGSCAALVASPADLVIGDLGGVVVIAGLVLAGAIDWQDIAEASEELAQRVSDALEGFSISDVVRPEALPETGTPPWMPTTVITPVPVPVAPSVTPGSMQDNDPRPTQPPPLPVPLPTPVNPTSCPTATPTPTRTPTATTTPTLTSTPDCGRILSGGQQPNIPSVTEAELVHCRPEAQHTLFLIRANGPFPYPRNDDVPFYNIKGFLPGPSDPARVNPTGYREYTVDTPNLSHRGQRRIITFGAVKRQPQQYTDVYYTETHYQTFVEVH